LIAAVMARRSVTMIATGGDLVTTARTYQFSGNACASMVERGTSRKEG